MNYWLVVIRYSTYEIETKFFNNENDATDYFNKIKVCTKFCTLSKVLNTTDSDCLKV